MANLIESVPCTDSLLVTEMAKFTITDIKDEFVFQNIAPINKPLYWTSYFKAEQESMIIIGNTVFTLTPNEWIFCSCPYVSSDGNFKIRFVNEGIYYSKENQLEISTLPSTYVPNIADYSTTVEVSSMIEQTATQIQLSVSETYYNKTQVESLIRIQKDRIDLMVLGQEGTENILENSSASDWSVYGHTTGVEESTLGEDTCVELTQQDSNPSWYGVLYDEDLLNALTEYREFRFSFDSDCDDINVFLLMELDSDISFVSPISNSVELTGSIYRHNISFRIVGETSELNFMGLAFKPSETTVKIANLRLFGNTQSIYQELSQTRKDLADNVISYINLSNEGVTISGDKINLIGMVNIINNDSSDGTNISGNKIRTGSIQSNNYSYLSGHYTEYGTLIDLDESIIRTKYFMSDDTGAYINGIVNAIGGQFGTNNPFSIGENGFDGYNEVSSYGQNFTTYDNLGYINYVTLDYETIDDDATNDAQVKINSIKLDITYKNELEEKIYSTTLNTPIDVSNVTTTLNNNIKKYHCVYTVASDINAYLLSLIPSSEKGDGTWTIVGCSAETHWKVTRSNYVSYSHIGTDYFRYNNFVIQNDSCEFVGSFKTKSLSLNNGNIDGIKELFGYSSNGVAWKLSEYDRYNFGLNVGDYNGFTIIGKQCRAHFGLSVNSKYYDLYVPNFRAQEVHTGDIVGTQNTLNITNDNIDFISNNGANIKFKLRPTVPYSNGFQIIYRNQKDNIADTDVLTCVNGKVFSPNLYWKYDYSHGCYIPFVRPYYDENDSSSIIVQKIGINHLNFDYNVIYEYTIGYGNTSYTLNTEVTVSDKRLKTNVEHTAITNALDIINNIPVRQFDWIETNKHQNIGFIADELEEIDNILVSGGGYREDGGMNIKSINTLPLIAYLTKAVQELSEKVERLERGE